MKKKNSACISAFAFFKGDTGAPTDLAALALGGEDGSTVATAEPQYLTVPWPGPEIAGVGVQQ